MSLLEITAIATAIPLDIEVFVHGAMCISYSGRCLLSNYMALRPSNQGICCQPCRFQYAVMEATRPGHYYPVAEDGQGTYIFNSRDLCMLHHLPSLIQAGVRSLKIEGRMKGIHYAATSVNIYRQAIDRYYQAPDQYAVQPHWQTELDKITIRGYCTGFYFDDPEQIMPQYSAPAAGEYQLVGNVIGATMDGKTLVEVRNRIRRGDSLERVNRAHPPMPVTVQDIIDDQHCLQETVHAGHRVWLDLGISCEKFDLLRKRLSPRVAHPESAPP